MIVDAVVKPKSTAAVLPCSDLPLVCTKLTFVGLKFRFIPPELNRETNVVVGLSFHRRIVLNSIFPKSKSSNIL